MDESFVAADERGCHEAGVQQLPEAMQPNVGYGLGMSFVRYVP